MIQNRSLSIDVLRGLTVALMIIVNTPGNGGTVFAPFKHATWNGFTPTDWVFPTFMFVVGNAMSFSLHRYESESSFLKKVFKRSLIIFTLGFLMYWFPFFHRSEGGWEFDPLSNTRISGVLQRIALGYFFGSLIVHYFKDKGAIIFSVIALFVYWIIMSFGGDYTISGNAVLKLDLFLFGEHHLYHGDKIAFDPEGLLSTLPAIVNVIAGYTAARFIQQRGNNYETISWLMMIGVVLVAIALMWNMTFPINKKLWTSTFVLLTVGIDLLILPMLISHIDIQKQTKGTYFFEVFGKNTLFLYLLSEIGPISAGMINIGDKSLSQAIFKNIFEPWAGSYMGSFLYACCWMFCCWLVGYWMDKKSIYIKV